MFNPLCGLIIIIIIIHIIIERHYVGASEALFQDTVYRKLLMHYNN